MEKDKIYKKELVLEKLCKERNWNLDNLTPKQRLIIFSHKEYKD